MPDFAQISANTNQVNVGSRVTLTCSASELLGKPPNDAVKQIGFNLSLFVTPSGGTQTDVSNLLSSKTGLGTDDEPSVLVFFTPDREGTYVATITARTARDQTQILATLVTDLLNAQGKITFLRVNDVGGGFGPLQDFIDAEVIVKLDSEPNKAMGFQLRNDNNGLAHQGALDLLVGALQNNWNVSIDYLLVRGRENGIAIRTAVTK